MGKASNTTTRSWMQENQKMQSMADELIDQLYRLYENGNHDALRAGLGSDVFRSLENYAAQRKVETAALEEWVHG